MLEVSDSLPRVVACIKALTGDVGAWGAGDDVAKIRLQEVRARRRVRSTTIPVWPCGKGRFRMD